MPGMRLIAGSGRSGTTWVLDAMATANGLRPIFEPLHPHVSPIGNRYAHRALAAGDDHPELVQFLSEVCAGRRIRLWSKYRRQGRWLFPPPAVFSTISDAGRLWRRWRKFLKEAPRLAMEARRRDPLVKCIRANLMLDWLSRQFDCRIVLVVRHPGAVIESEMRGSWKAEFTLDRYRGDTRLHEITSDRYRALLERPLTPIEALATRWVIENQWVIEQAAANGVTIVCYERLMSSPDEEWQRICRALQLPSAPAPAVLARPSQQSAPNRSAATVEASEEPRWLRVLSREQVESIQGILDQARFDLYAMSGPEPRDKSDHSVRGDLLGISR